LGQRQLRGQKSGHAQRPGRKRHANHFKPNCIKLILMKGEDK
jgi:hypothetical protein